MKALREALLQLPKEKLVEMILNLVHAINFAEKDMVEIAKAMRGGQNGH